MADEWAWNVVTHCRSSPADRQCVCSRRTWPRKVSFVLLYCIMVQYNIPRYKKLISMANAILRFMWGIADISLEECMNGQAHVLCVVLFFFPFCCFVFSFLCFTYLFLFCPPFYFDLCLLKNYAFIFVPFLFLLFSSVCFGKYVNNVFQACEHIFRPAWKPLHKNMKPSPITSNLIGCMNLLKKFKGRTF